jgi:hypothetical protein
MILDLLAVNLGSPSTGRGSESSNSISGSIEIMKWPMAILAAFLVCSIGCSESDEVKLRREYNAQFSKYAEEYFNGTIVEAEKALLHIVELTEWYRARAPSLEPYHYHLSLAKTRLSLIYQKLGQTDKAKTFMIEAVTSSQTPHSKHQGKNGKQVDESVTPSWDVLAARLVEQVNTLDERGNPRWRRE